MHLAHSIRPLHRARPAVAAVAVGLALALAAPSVFAQCQTNQNCWPPPGGCAYPAPGPIFYPGSPGPVGIQNAILYDPNACAPMPPQGGVPIDSFFDIFVELELSTNGGTNWTPYSLPLRPSTVRIQPPTPVLPDLVFDTEMLQLDLTGGGMPGGTLIRESPTLPSVGRTAQRNIGGGLYRIDSFFDVFTELSLDGGQTWMPSNQPLHITTIDNLPTPNRASTWGTLKVMYR